MQVLALVADEGLLAQEAHQVEKMSTKTWRIGGVELTAEMFRDECRRRRAAGLVIYGRGCYKQRNKIRRLGGIFDDALAPDLVGWLLPSAAIMEEVMSFSPYIYAFHPGEPPASGPRKTRATANEKRLEAEQLPPEAREQRQQTYRLADHFAKRCNPDQ